jgi:RNA polymerase sigma-70 factor (ECF subfamily)
MQVGPFEVPQDSDEECMPRYAAGEVVAIHVLYQRHRGGLYRYFLRQSVAA